MTTVSIVIDKQQRKYKNKTTMQQQLPICQCIQEDAILRMNLW
jgi:hypothetical protein